MRHAGWLAATVALGGWWGAAAATDLVLERCLVSVVAEAKVPAREAAVLVELPVREGMVVAKGDIIGRLADDQPRMERKRAAAEHEQALAKAASDVDERYAVAAEGAAEKAYQKAEKSHASVQGAVVEVERDRLRLEWEKTKLQIEQSQLERRLSGLTAAAKQVEVEAADNAIERRLIRSPIDGVVVDVAKHEGEWMQPGDTLAHVVRTDKLRVEGYVKIREALPAAVENRPVTVVVELDGGRREQFQGRIAFVKPVVESGDYRVFAEVENRRDGGEWLLPAGQTAVMTIHLDAAAAPAGR
jgi:multidrug efflux pump subunit AcrA (membrane-fusion protein)